MTLEGFKVKKKENAIYHELLVIGGGASGLMAAIAAARAGTDTAVLEHTDKIGKKLLSTGNGHCNLTNMVQQPDCYRGHDSGIAWQIIEKFPETATIDFFRSLGLVTKDRGGYIYPWSNQAVSVLRAIKTELYRLHIPVCYRTKPVKLYKDAEKKHFYCVTENGLYECSRLILAAGSKAAPKTGSDGSGYALAEQLGHTVSPVLPALVQLTAAEECFKRFSGIRAEGQITLYIDGAAAAEEEGELQLTAYGLSGIPVFQVSRFAAEGLYRGAEVTAEIDFCPCLSKTELADLTDRRLGSGIRLGEILGGILHERIAEEIASMAKDKEESIRLTKHFPVTITGTKDFEQCQACMGGVPLFEIYPGTMESRVTEGLYLAGEILDVDGSCGGYNLQWAWSSGHLAGVSAAESIMQECRKQAKEDRI